MADAPRGRADLGQPARGAEHRPGRRHRLPHHHRDPRPARRSCTCWARTSSSSRSRPCRCSTTTPPRPASRLDVGRAWVAEAGARHRRRRLHRQQPGRPAAAPTASRSSSTTTSRPASGASSTGARGIAARDGGRGRRARRRRPRAARWRAATPSSTSPANADVRRGLEHPEPRPEPEHDRHVHGARGDARATAPSASSSRRPARSTASPRSFPTPEDCPFPVQTSLYGASKLAGEGLIQAYCEGYGFTGVILRFVSVLGERYTHGHLFDFYPRAARRPVAAPRARRRPAAQVVPLRRRLRRGGHRCSRATPSAAGVAGLQPRHRRGLGRRHVGASGLRATWASSPRSSTRAASAAGSATARSSTSTARGCAPSGGRRALTIAEAVERTLDWFDANEWVFEPAAARVSVIFTRAPLRISPRRRRHRPALVLPRARRLPHRRRDRQVRLHAHPHGLPAALPAEVLGVRGGRRPEEIRHPILRETLLPPLGRQPARDRLGRRHPRRAPASARPARSRSAC